MKNIIKLFLTFLCMAASLTAYSQNEHYNARVQELGTRLKQIQSPKATIKQSIEIVYGNIVQFVVTSTDIKNKTSSEAFRFNPSDIDPASVKQVTLGIDMFVELKTRKELNFIELIRDDEVVAYKSNLKINAIDIDNSREIVDAVKNLITEAEEIEVKKNEFESYDQAISRLTTIVVNAIVPMKVGGIQQEHKQSLIELQEKKGKVEYTDQVNEITRKYQFNLTDIDINSIQIIIFLRNVAVKFSTKSEAMIIAVKENEIRKPFENTIQIYPKDIENAKQIQRLSKIAIHFLLGGETIESAESPTNGNDRQEDFHTSQATTESDTTATLIKEKIKIKEPEWLGEIVFVNTYTGTGIPLEKQTSSVKTKAGASLYLTGMGKITSRVSVRGKVSPMRVAKNDTLFFIFRYENNITSPRKVVALYQFEKKGDSRVLEVGSVGTFSGVSSGDLDRINLVVEKYGQSSYLIMLINPTPGEYGFTLGEEDTQDLDLFGVD